MVTHDQQEALSLANVVVVMRDGRIEQVGAPEELYAAPATAWAAEFLGAGIVLPGVVQAGTVRCELGSFPAPEAGPGAVDVVVRPESVSIMAVNGAAPPAGATMGTVLGRSYFGHDQLVRLQLDSGQEVQSRGTGLTPWHVGQAVHVTVDAVHVLAKPSPSTS
jgi:ABC-type Fe3+/spermidine/putrescine transport system ATPase subunit